MDVVRFLLAKGADIEARCNAGNSAVCAAAGKGNSDILSVLLEKGAAPNACNKRGYSPLLLAAYSGVADAVSVLLRYGGDPNIADNDGLTPLMAAAYQGSIESVVAPLAAGASPNVAATDGKTPLMVAANRGALECVVALLAAGATGGASGASLLAYAMCAPTDADTIAVKIIEARGLPSDLYQGYSPMCMAISHRRHIVVEALLIAGADPNQSFVINTDAGEESLTPLIVAASMGDAECAKILLRHGADPNLNAGKITALGAAKIAGHENIVRLLIDHDVRVEGAAVLLWRAEGDPGFKIRGLFAADLAEAWRVSFDHRDKEAEILTELAQSPHIQERMTLLRLSIPPDTANSYPTALLLLLGLALEFIGTKASEAARIVTANHVGVRKRHDDEEKARTRCIEELATMIARGSELYEDSEEALAAAEFVLSRLPYRQLAEAARSSNAHAPPLQGDGLGYEDRCRIDLETNSYLVRKTPPTGDQGADLLASKADVTYAVQCKNYAGAVGNGAVQEAISARAYYATDYAVVVSDGKFTTSARELAARAKVILCKMESIGHIDLICAALA